MRLFVETEAFKGSTHTGIFRQYDQSEDNSPLSLHGRQSFDLTQEEIQLSLLGFHFPMMIIKVINSEVKVIADDGNRTQTLEPDNEIIFRGFKFLLKS